MVQFPRVALSLFSNVLTPLLVALCLEDSCCIYFWKELMKKGREEERSKGREEGKEEIKGKTINTDFDTFWRYQQLFGSVTH